MDTLKKVPVSRLKIGMFVVKCGDSWLANPFWRSRFLIKTQCELTTLCESSVSECWIDTKRGLDYVDIPDEIQTSENVLPLKQVESSVLNVTTRNFDDEIASAEQLCINSRKAIVDMFADVRLGNVVDVAVSEALVCEIVDSVERNPGAMISLARLKSEDDYTFMHSVAVCALMIALAKAMKLSSPQVRSAGLAGLLHDIGKAKIPLNILNKPSALDEHEFSIIMQHPSHGYQALADSSIALDVQLACLHHHERFDGRGYPSGHQRDNIPLLARMAAVCDVYDAITSNRPYKRGWDPADALAKMLSWHGHFDPKILSAFVEVVGIYPTGSLVRLKSGRLAVVVEQGPISLTKPVVRIFYCTRNQTTLQPELLALGDRTNADSIMRREDRGDWPIPLIEGLWAGESRAELSADATKTPG